MPIPTEERAVLTQAIDNIQGELYVLYTVLRDRHPAALESVEPNLEGLRQHADKARGVVDALNSGAI